MLASQREFPDIFHQIAINSPIDRPIAISLTFGIGGELVVSRHEASIGLGLDEVFFHACRDYFDACTSAAQLGNSKLKVADAGISQMRWIVLFKYTACFLYDPQAGDYEIGGIGRNAETAIPRHFVEQIGGRY
jgi:hypothetical protein